MKYTEQKEKIKSGYDLNNPEDKKVIRDFEVMVEGLKRASLKYALWFYGEPKEMIPAGTIGKREFPGSTNPRRVQNNITGLVDGGIVQYLLDIKAISRRYVKKEHPGRSWAVGPDIKAYEDFYEKKRVLEELKDKRSYAETQNNESFDALIESRSELIKTIRQ